MTNDEFKSVLKNPSMQVTTEILRERVTYLRGFLDGFIQGLNASDSISNQLPLEIKDLPDGRIQVVEKDEFSEDLKEETPRF